MRKIVCILLILTSSVYAQKVEIGTIFIIEFNNPGGNMEFNIVSKESYTEIIDISKIDSKLIKNKPKENQIIGVFANGKFGNRVNPMLVLFSGLNNNIDYDLKIKLPQESKCRNTSVSSLFKGIKSIEYWPYAVDQINFKGFKVIQAEKFKTSDIDEKIDSTCIKSADKNIELGKLEFKSHLRSIVTRFEGNNKFKLEKLLEYEKSVNSEDASLGHFWSLGESIYQNKKAFKFGNPLTFTRIECPYFKSSTDYFYTKKKRDIKVISFNWQTFKKSDYEINPEIEKVVTERFLEKYDFIVGAVSELLGKPLDIVQEENSGRIDTKWRSISGINIYLFRFKNYNEIRLYIYKE